MKKIKLSNRYNANLWLEHIDKDLWQLKSKNVSDLSYMRIGYEEDNKIINFIDPSGGPFLSIGSEIKNINETYKIEEIFPNGYILRLSVIEK